ncbi:MAG: fibronectin type III domain-containing protein [Arachnia sp.]
MTPCTPRRGLAIFRLIAVLVLVLGLLPPETAAAAPATPTKPTLVSASRSAVGLSWKAVPGATSYTVTYASSSSMKGAKSTKTTKTTAELTKLSASTTYYVTVTATKGSSKSKASTKLSAKTKARTSYTHLAPTGLTSSAAQPGSAKLTWKSRGSGLTYRVSVSTKSDLSGAKHYDVKATSKTISGLKEGVTYYVGVRVISPAKKGLSGYSPKIKLRTSVAAVSTGPATITVASYNVGSKTVEAKNHPWTGRRSAVASTILGQKPDVIGLQEASQGKLDGADISQAEDLVKRLGSPYKLASTARYNCVNPKTPYKCVAKYQGASNSQKIAYNSQTLTLVSHGARKTTSAKKKMTEYRYVEWATFQHKGTGKRFFFVNVHLDPGQNASAAAVRVTQMKEILAVIEEKNPQNLPAYVVGDFNSTKWSDGSNQPYDAMRKAGFVDPLGNTYMSKTTTSGATVKKRINTHFSSHNGWQRVAPQKSWINGIYLDYIWTSKGIEVPEWETVVKVDKNGKFIGTIPSDHNMLRATTVIR